MCDSKTKITPREAYAAMFCFLEEYYRQTGSKEIGGLLGELALLPDGKTADPAAWEDWCRCVAKSIEDNVDLDLKLK